MDSLGLLSYSWSLNTALLVKIVSFDFGGLTYPPTYGGDKGKCGEYDILKNLSSTLVPQISSTWPKLPSQFVGLFIYIVRLYIPFGLSTRWNLPSSKLVAEMDACALRSPCLYYASAGLWLRLRTDQLRRSK